MKIVVTGSSGLVGSALIEALHARGDYIVRITRSAAAGDATIVLWNPEARQIIDTQPLEGADAVVHLAGESIGTARWTPMKKAAIRNSRVQGTGLLAQTLTHLHAPPKLFLSASAVGYYGLGRGDEELTEDTPIGHGFLAGVCADWEEATRPASEAGIRTANLRIGFIVSAKGGGFPNLKKLFRTGLAGPLGNGRQWMSIIALDDVVGAILHLLGDKNTAGPVNLTSPVPTTNKDFTRGMAKYARRPALLPAPAFALRLALGELADELLLASHRVLPRKLLQIGYQFKHPHLESILKSAW